MMNTEVSNEAIVILGMHRSGTSLITRIISKLEHALPLDLMPPQSDNPDGFYESLSVTRLNNEMLEHVGSSWDSPVFQGSLNATTMTNDYLASQEALYRSFGQRAEKAISTNFSGQGKIVLKDPRISLFLHFWLKALNNTGFKVKCIVAHRRPFDVALSLRKRNAIPLAKGLRVWARYNAAILRSLCLETEPSVFVMDFEQLLTTPKQELASMMAFLGASVTPAIEAMVDPTRNMSQNQLSDTEIEGIQSKPIHSLSNSLKSLKKNAGEWPSDAIATLEEYGDYCRFAGQLTPYPAKLIRPLGSELPLSKNSQHARVVLLHYHLFKNAGTSLDTILKRNFGAAWVDAEFSGGPENIGIPKQVQDWIENNPTKQVFSTHTARGPLPVLPKTLIIPLIFIRHPIDRLISAYHFERKQESDSYGAVLAKVTDFKEYIETRLSKEGDRACRNFQCQLLGSLFRNSAETELDAALDAVDRLPWVGLVESFEQSVARLAALLVNDLPDFQIMDVHKNVTNKSNVTIDQKLQNLRDEFGSEFVETLIEVNRADFEIYAAVRKKYE